MASRNGLNQRTRPVVRALQVLRNNRSASLVSVQRFRGKLGGRQGNFVLQGSEVVENGWIKATWFVVPGSATGDLLGLRGEGGFDGQFGKGVQRNAGVLVRIIWCLRASVHPSRGRLFPPLPTANAEALFPRT